MNGSELLNHNWMLNSYQKPISWIFLKIISFKMLKLVIVFLPKIKIFEEKSKNQLLEVESFSISSSLFILKFIDKNDI